MNGSEVLAGALVAAGVERVFSHAGGTISHPLQYIARAGIGVVTLPNEAGAGHAAQAAYRVTGKPQVVLVTSGPGVTNAMTPLADAYFDGDAVLFIAGQVSTREFNLVEGVRQRGFQEVDTVAIVTAVSKAAATAPSAKSVGTLVNYLLHQAMGCLQMDPRPGPCVLDLPVDVQREEAAGLPALSWEMWRPKEAVRGVGLALKALAGARRPMVLLGRGALSCVVEVRAFLDAFQPGQWVIATTLPAVGAVPTTDPRYCGFVGHTGMPWANRELDRADVLLVLGARLDVRQVGTAAAEWARWKTIIRVDHNYAELEHGRMPVKMAFECDVVDWVATAMKELGQ